MILERKRLKVNDDITKAMKIGVKAHEEVANDALIDMEYVQKE